MSDFLKEPDRTSFALIENAAMGRRQQVRYGEHPFVMCFPHITFPKSVSEPCGD